MRRLIALAALSAMAAASAASAETWKAYSAVSDKGLQWSYDADYSYRDAASGMVVIQQAIGKVGATPRLGPSAPGAADGVGNVTAVDCKAKSLMIIGSYAPSKPLAIADTWRTGKAAKANSADDKALVAAACEGADKLPTK
jgi:hypothetical protein